MDLLNSAYEPTQVDLMWMNITLKFANESFIHRSMHNMQTNIEIYLLVRDEEES